MHCLRSSTREGGLQWSGFPVWKVPRRRARHGSVYGGGWSPHSSPGLGGGGLWTPPYPYIEPWGWVNGPLPARGSRHECSRMYQVRRGRKISSLGWSLSVVDALSGSPLHPGWGFHSSGIVAGIFRKFLIMWFGKVIEDILSCAPLSQSFPPLILTCLPTFSQFVVHCHPNAEVRIVIARLLAPPLFLRSHRAQLSFSISA